MERRAFSPAEARAGCPRDCRRDDRRYNIMRSFPFKTSLLLTALVTGMCGCCSGFRPETVSTAKATWQGEVGTAVTITQSGGTKELEGVKSVSFRLCGRSRNNDLWAVADFTVPVMKLEPNAVTLFFSTDPLDAGDSRATPCRSSRGEDPALRLPSRSDLLTSPPL